MEFRHMRRQRVDMTGLQSTGCGELGQQGPCRKATHAQHPFDRFAGTAQLGRTGAARDRQQVEVELGRGAPIQAQFLGQEMPAQGQGREIQEGELDRLLELVGVVAGKPDGRDMGIDPDGTGQAEAEVHAGIVPPARAPCSGMDGKKPGRLRDQAFGFLQTSWLTPAGNQKT